LHLGHGRTFWTAYQRALNVGGTLVFRNEDLDTLRSRPEFVGAMFGDLRWLGIRWQEGPDVGGPYAPYTQSERREFYLQAWRKLRASGTIYPCVCSRKDLAQAAGAPHDVDDEPIYPGTCRERKSDTEIPADANWRFRVPDGEGIEFLDGNLGRQRFVAGKDFGDFAVWRRDDIAAYQLAVVVDDAAMRITEVVRGADLLRSTARQILLYKALGLEAPAWYHCELVVDEQGERLAKRHDALALRTMREKGIKADEVRGGDAVARKDDELGGSS
jgi:glutamyl/glutaminyl-tRNA synthetase